MSGNGQRRPPRPRIELVAGAPTPEEGAAIVAALEQFLVDTAPSPAPAPALSPWQIAALREGVAARLGAEPPRGFGRGWS